MNKQHAHFVALMMTGFLSACGGGSSSDDSAAGDDSAVSLIDVERVGMILETNADIAYAAYSDSVETAAALEAAINTFAGDRTQANLDAAKLAWLASREPYGQTEVFRFRLSPIDSTNYADEDGPEGDINAWPLGEALIDYVVDGTDFGDAETGVTSHDTGINYPAENIINSAVVIDADLISNTATADDEHDVIAGYHAIEFMLWGQDLNLDGSADTVDSRELSTGGDVLNSGGHRPLTDFTTDSNADRRIQYLQVVVAKLIDDLESVRDGWASGAAYRTAFTSISTEAEAREKLAEILTGMGTLSEGELAGERMQIAFSTGSQEDEHSCFSDNTHRDIWLNAEGVTNSYYGTYAGYDSDQDGLDDEITRAVDGYGFDDYIADLDIASLTEVAEDLEAAFALTETNYERIDSEARNGSPVDVQIETANRQAGEPMYDTIISLNAQSAEIAALADVLEISASVVDDDASGCDTTDPTADCG